MKELDDISHTIKNLRNQMDSFVDAINSAIERSETTPELSIRKFFFKLGKCQMPSRLFKGVGSFDVLTIDEASVVIRQEHEAGGSFIVHTHNDAIESVLLVKGLVEETVSGHILRPGDSFRTEVNQPHQYKIIEDCIMVSAFIYVT